MAYGVMEHFPHSTPRKGQREVIRRLKQCIESEKVDYVLLQAPTGSGKTSSAGTPISWDGSGYYLADQKIHQRQVRDEFEEQTGMCMGRGNYECGDNRNPPCADVDPDEATCPYRPVQDGGGMHSFTTAEGSHLHWPAGIEEHEKCSYYAAKEQAKRSPIACLNYAYFLNEVYYNDHFEKRNVMICDEAHNLDSKLQSFLRFQVDQTITGELGLETRDMGPYVEDWRGWITGVFQSSLNARVEELENWVARQFQLEPEDRDPRFGARLGSYEMLQNVQENISRFTREYDSDIEWVAERMYDDSGEIEAVEFTPVHVAPFAQRLLFDYADTVVLMSATILDNKQLMRTLGLASKGDSTWTMSLPSQFPVKNRPIYYYDAPVLRYKDMDRKFPKTCKLIENICSQYPDQSGIIHSVSFENEQRILENVGPEVGKRLYFHHNNDRDEILEDFKQSENGILMSPSMYEGVDLKYDQSRFQIIAKIPYLPLGSKQVQRRKEVDPQWYTWATVVRMVQSFGRSVRASDDHAETYIVDGSFKNLYKRSQHLFPEYVTDALEKRNVVDLL